MVKELGLRTDDADEETLLVVEEAHDTDEVDETEAAERIDDAEELREWSV